MLGRCCSGIVPRFLESSNILNKSHSLSRRAAGNAALGFMLLRGQREIKGRTVGGEAPPITGCLTVKGR